MTGSGSEHEIEEGAFVESDSAQTKLPYDKGGVPFYIAIAWVCFIIAYITVMFLMALPDLQAWIAS